jgi:sec-independent protein translocase protein TatB
VNESLGDDLPDLRDLDLRKYHPKTFIRSQLLGDDLADDTAPTVHRGSATGSAGLAAGGATGAVAAQDAARPRDRATPPPFDPDAT